ncbi:hypothetical protein JCM16358_22850 [Halanaerocella petrolearia]
MSDLKVASGLRKKDLVARIKFLQDVIEQTNLSDRTIDRLDNNLAAMYKEIVYNDPHFRDQLKQNQQSKKVAK